MERKGWFGLSIWSGKADGVLSGLRRLSICTDVLSRTLLWKVFGRSTMECALSLALAISGRPSAVLMKGPENVQNRALAWIFDGMSQSYAVTRWTLMRRLNPRQE